MNQEQLQHYFNIISEVQSKQLFFIGGAQKSGTTWLQHILDGHDEIVCSGEGHFADALAAPIARIMKSYNDRLDLIAERVYEHSPFYSHYTPDELKFTILALTSLMMNRREINDDIKCIGDKTPINITHLPLLISIFPEAKFIHIIRDGRDVVVSIIKHAQRVLKADDDSDWNFTTKTAEFADKWAQYVSQGQAFAETYPNNFYEVRYEDLHTDPEGTLTQLLDFLGVKNNTRSISQCIDNASFKKLSGGRDRGEENSDSFFRKGIIGDWQNHMDEQAQSIFMDNAGETLKKLGY